MTREKWIMLVIAALLAVCFSIWKSGWRPKGVSVPDTKGLQSFWNDRWTNGRLLPILACFALIHLSIYKLAPKFWVSQAWGDWSSIGWFWGIQIAFAVVASVKPEDRANPVKYKFSTVAVYLLAITFIVHLGGWDIENELEEIRAKWGENSGDQTASVTLRRAPYIPKGTTKYPRAEMWPDKEVAEKILAGQWDLLAACYRESGLKQLDSDGKPLVNINKNGTTDTGICQINSVHDEELKRLKLDKNKLRDNLVFALILYNKEGLRPWATPPGSKLVFEVEVTRKESNTFRLPKVIMGFEHKKPILIAFNDESHVVKEIANELDLTPFTPIADYKFMSATDEKVVVTVTYDYK